jgi:hypothetical protein
MVGAFSVIPILGHFSCPQEFSIPFLTVAGPTVLTSASSVRRSVRYLLHRFVAQSRPSEIE